MNQELLEAKENILKEQLNIVQLEKEKYACIVSQDYEQARRIKEQIEKAHNNLDIMVITYCRSIFREGSQNLKWKDLLFVLASLGSKYQNTIMETELQEQCQIFIREQVLKIK